MVKELARYAVTKGIELIRELTEEGLLIFDIEDAQRTVAPLGIGKGHLRKILHELTAGQWIKRIRRGLYVITMGTSGLVTVHPFAIATHLVQPSAISHWSALSFHGFTEQIPLTVTATTPKKVVTPSMHGADSQRRTKHTWKIDQTQYEYVSVKYGYYFGLEEIWIDEFFKIKITDKERTIIDCFAFPRMFGGIQWVLSTLEEVIDQIDLEKLVSYAIRYGKVSVMKRIGWSLEKLGVHESTLDSLRFVKASGFYEIDSTRVKRGTYDHNWRIVDNTAEKMVS
jgi:predicted transcriptional regulator of viral defense system